MTYAPVGGMGGLAVAKSAASRWKQLAWDGTGAAVGGGLAYMRGGDVLAGAQYGMMAASLTKQFACFAAGTPLLTPEGSKPIEEFRVGDYLLSRHEDQPDGPVMAKRVEEVFVRRAVIIELVIAGRVIRTTAEHPFFVPDRGWTPAAELCPGVALVGGDGEVHVVEDIRLIEEPARVYNLSVADFHTYFVGCDEWGLSVWAHNSTCGPDQVRAAIEKIVDRRTRLGDANLQKVADAINAGDIRTAKTILDERLVGVGQVRARRIIEQIIPESSLGRVTGGFDAVRPGPLADEYARTFAGGHYHEIVLHADTTLYRAGDASRPLGRFFAMQPPQGVLSARIDSAVLPVWPGGGVSPINSVVTVNVLYFPGFPRLEPMSCGA